MSQDQVIEVAVIYGALAGFSASFIGGTLSNWFLLRHVNKAVEGAQRELLDVIEEGKE